MAPFDEGFYKQAMERGWVREFCETFASAEDYLARGFGFAMTQGEKLVSRASSMTVYDGGIEIHIATDEEYCRMELVRPCVAALIRERMRRGIRHCWDAKNLISKKLTLKLGYEYGGEYTTICMERQLRPR